MVRTKITTKKPSKHIPCINCGTRTSTLAALKRHMSTKHSTETTKYECTICNRYFARKEYAIKHIGTHHHIASEKDREPFVITKQGNLRFNAKDHAVQITKKKSTPPITKKIEIIDLTSEIEPTEVTHNINSQDIIPIKTKRSLQKPPTKCKTRIIFNKKPEQKYPSV